MKKVVTFFSTWKFLFKYEKYKILWGIGLAVTGFSSVISIFISKEIINSILIHSDEIISIIPNAIFWGGIYGFILLLQNVIGSSSTMQILNIKDRIKSRIDQILMEKVGESYDVTEFEIPENMDLIRLASIGGQSMPNCFFDSIKALQYFVTVLGILILLTFYHPLIALMVFLPAIPHFYAQLKVRSYTYSAMMGTSPEFRKMEYIIELILGVTSAKEIKVYRSGDFFLRKYKNIAEHIFAFSKACRKKVVLSAIIWGCVSACGIGIAYLYIIKMALTKEITIGDVVVYSGSVFYAGSSIRGLIQTTSDLWTRLLEVESFFSYIHNKRSTPIVNNASKTFLDKDSYEWEFKNVSFSYPGLGKNTLNDISFKVKQGEKIALVGSNGAGKTTLLKLMLGLLKPNKGIIKFRNIDLNEWDISLFRKELGVIFQDFSKFKLTLYENIEIAANGEYSEEMKMDAVLKAAKLTGVDNIAKFVPNGYNTLLGKEFLNGTDLSVGQWQKVALARAFLRNASVIVLDEPTASLDTQTEQIIFKQFLSLSQDKTALLISHRFSITPLVDRIFTLEDGCLIEEGNHEQLLAYGGKYAQMYLTQAEMYWPNPSKT